MILKERRLRLRGEIRALLVAFAEKTGLEVESCNFDLFIRGNYVSGDPEVNCTAVSLTTRLPF